jgi:4-hydroxy-3-methylbut-2-enyl diphosphate reductase
MYTIIKITPSGFCFGVKRAIDLLEKIIKEYSDKTIYCVHQIVHNPKVIKYFEGK